MTVVVSEALNVNRDSVYEYAIANPGVGYAPLDVLTFNTGGNDATLRVDSVDGGGGILTTTLLTYGTGYSVVPAVVLTGGSGAGATADITEILSGRLSSPNSFYRAEAYNVGCSYTNHLSLSGVGVTQAVTFANGGNCLGIVLAISGCENRNDRDVVVDLEEQTAPSVWTVRATATRPYDEINPEFTDTPPSGYNAIFAFTPFMLAVPYAVTTDADKWRFHVYQSGGSVGTWYLGESANNYPFYVAYCDNPVSFNDNDCLIVKDQVVIDQTASIRGVLGTGDAANGIASVVCRNLDRTPENISLLVWENPPAASYTFTIDGAVMLGAFSGFRGGTLANPIPFAQQAVLNFVHRTVGTAESEIRNPYYRNLQHGKAAVFFYGEVPANRSTTLASDAASGQPDIVTTDDMSALWSIGDRIVVGKPTTRGQGSTTVHTIQNIVGTTITLSANLDTTSRKAGGQVLNFERYGIVLKSANPSYYMRLFLVFSYFWEMSGCEFDNVRLYVGDVGTYPGYMQVRSGQEFLVEDCCMHSNTNSLAYFVLVNVAPEGYLSVRRNHCFRANVLGSVSAVYNFGYSSGWIYCDANIVVANYNVAAGSAGTTNYKLSVTNNIFEGGFTTVGFVYLHGKGSICTGNYFWGCSASIGALMIGQLVKGVLGGNVFNNNTYGISFEAYISIGCIDTDSVFGDEVGNYRDVIVQSGALALDYELRSPTGAVVIYPDGEKNFDPGSHLRISEYNDTPNDDKGYLPYGLFQRTGDGLTDPTVHTTGVGRFALRFQPTSAANLLQWSQVVPTGDIQGRAMAVAVWVKINDAAYWAGTHQKPKLRVVYDGATEAVAVAAESTDWQLLFVVFSPATTAGRISVTLEGSTDAAGSDAYFYVDDMAILYPAGYAPNFGGLDIWDAALPVVPSLATVISAFDVWTAPATVDYGAGSIGELLKIAEKKIDDAGVFALSG